jgi:YidC/Oxa1 family membrane protein insertase
MTDIRRTLLWVVFCMSLVLLWDAWNKSNGQPSLFGNRATPTATAPTVGSAPAGNAASGVPSVATPAPTSAAAPADVPTTAPVASAQVTVTTDVLRATYDFQGGNLVRLELLRYADAVDSKHNVVLFDRSRERTYAAQTGLISATSSLPNHLTPMTLVPGETELKPSSDALNVSFESADVNGVKLRKTWTLARGSYTMKVTHEVINIGAAPVQPQLYLQLMRDGNPPAGESSFYFTFTGPALYTDASKFHKIDFKDIEKNKVAIPKTANDGWVAMVQHYFASAWLLAPDVPREYRVAKVNDNLYSIAMVQNLPSIAPGAKVTSEATLFAGPQEEKKLETLAPGLELVKDYGWFTILAKPLFWLLDHLYKLLGNWGWAIVALVVLLKAAFYWLNAKAYGSMAKMKAINPKVMEMRERLKDKPQQMQQEMMRIYREEKVNPLGGCLPIFVQMPFFIALYWVLLSSVEMRNAPWIGWITDLSAKDPYFILPVLMTASSLVQTWLNPTPPDPVQARMMWIMPLVFSVMFFFFPAGLVLYWLTNNILSIAQQWFINKRLGVTK